MRFLILLFAAISTSAMAVDSDPPLRDPALQQRYETLTHELRCLVCQNETIADSGADLAADLRGQVRSQLLAGKTDDEIKIYMVDRYGDFVLFRPPWQPSTWLLWVGPFLLLGIGALALVMVIRLKAKLAGNSPGINPDDARFS